MVRWEGGGTGRTLRHAACLGLFSRRAAAALVVFYMMLSRSVFVFNLALAAAGICNDMSTDCGNW